MYLYKNVSLSPTLKEVHSPLVLEWNGARRVGGASTRSLKAIFHIFKTSRHKYGLK